jgi:phage terminase small subunit
MALTPKQQLFVQEYLVDLNATRAAIRAGYSAASAHNQGYRMMMNDEVAKAIQRAMDERSERTRISCDWVIEELSLIARANIYDYLCTREGRPTVNLHSLTREQAAAIKEVKVDSNYNGGGTHLKMNDKLAALIALGRHLERAMARDERRSAALAEEMKAAMDQEAPVASEPSPPPAETAAPEPAATAGPAGIAEAPSGEAGAAPAEVVPEPLAPAKPAKISAEEAERRFLEAYRARSAREQAGAAVPLSASAGPGEPAFEPAIESLAERASGASATMVAARTG